MKHLIFAALLLLPACVDKQTPPPAAADTERAAIALVNEWAAIGTEGRWDDLPGLFADVPSFAWVEQGVIAYSDRDVIVAGVTQANDSGLIVRTTATDIAATALAPDAAAVRANVSIVFGDPAAGGFTFDGVLTGVAIKRDDRWMFLQGHLSSPPPREPDEALP